MTSEAPLWIPSPDRIRSAPLTAFARQAAERAGRPLPSYADLHAWSVDDREAFGASDLWRGQADALGRVHRLEHVVGEATQLVVHAVDRRRLLTKDR